MFTIYLNDPLSAHFQYLPLSLKIINNKSKEEIYLDIPFLSFDCILLYEYIIAIDNDVLGLYIDSQGLYSYNFKSKQWKDHQHKVVDKQVNYIEINQDQLYLKHIS